MGKKTISNTFTVNTVEEGASPFVVDLDDGFIGVACDSSGYIVSDASIPLNLSAYYGTTSVINACIITDNHLDVDIDVDVLYDANNRGKISVVFYEGNSIAEFLAFTFTVTHPTYGTRKIALSINGVRGGANGSPSVVYSLVPSATNIIKQKSGDYVPSGNITCGVTKNVGGVQTTPSSSEYTLTMKVNGGQEQAYAAVAASTITSNIEYILRVNSRVVDRETLPLLEDGTDGTDGTDGESAPYYFQEWFAWSNDTSTASATTAPTISGSWTTSIPAQGSYSYLWKKIIRHVWNESTRTYTQEAAQYFRMSGTDGTSIHTKGSVDYQNSSQGSGTALNLISNPLDGDAYVVGIDLDGNQGWLYQWTVESNSWIPLGQFKGESGKTYYTHVAWATNVDTTTTPVTVTGFITSKSPNDTTHLWMGVYVDENSGQDPSLASLYTWSYTKGVQGEQGVRGAQGEQGDDAVMYKIDFDNYVFSYNPNTRKNTVLIKGKVYKTIGDETTIFTQLTTSMISIIFYDVNGNLVRSVNSADIGVENGTFITRSGNASAPSSPNAEASFVVVLTINNINVAQESGQITRYGSNGEDGQVGRFPYYSGVEFDENATTPLYVINDVQAPYFKVTQDGQERYYVYNPVMGVATSMSMKDMWDSCVDEQRNKSFNNYPWQAMTNDFNYLITKALFANFARLATFVMNGNLMVSLQGRWRGLETKDGSNTITTPSIYIDDNTLVSENATQPIYSFIDETDPQNYHAEVFSEVDGDGDDNVGDYYIAENVEFSSRTVYMFERSSATNCSFYLRYWIDEGSEIYTDYELTANILFTFKEDIRLDVVAVQDTSGKSYSFSDATLHAYNFSPNIAINGLTGKVVMSNAISRGTFSGSGDFTELNVRTQSNLQGVTYIHQPIFYPDYDAGSDAQDVPPLNSLPQIPLCKYVEVVRKDSARGLDTPDSAGKLIIERSTGYLRYIPILTDDLSVLRPSS